jgi:hypothetical protein
LSFSLATVAVSATTAMSLISYAIMTSSLISPASIILLRKVIVVQTYFQGKACHNSPSNGTLCRRVLVRHDTNLLVFRCCLSSHSEDKDSAYYYLCCSGSVTLSGTREGRGHQQYLLESAYIL